MDAHGVLQHQHLAPPHGHQGGGHSPDSQNTSRSTPPRGGGQTPIGLNAVSINLSFMRDCLTWYQRDCITKGKEPPL
jgi:hypothetical protein